MKETYPTTRFIWALVIILMVLVLTVSCIPRVTEDKSITISGQILPANETDKVQLPEGSRIIVKVQDTSIADKSAVVLGEQILTNVQSLPTVYEISVDRSDMEEAAQTSVSVRIEDADGNLLYINDTVHRVSMDNKSVDVVIIAIKTSDPASALPSAFDGQVWQWLVFKDSADGAESNDITVDDPAQYTLQLLKDGTYLIQADCNQGSGAYTLEGSTLMFAPGSMTLAACGPESLSNQYIALLGDVVTFTFDAEGNLNLNLKMDAGNLVFAPVPKTAAPLSGTSWMLKSITVGDAITSTEIDAEITAEFKDGRMTGSAGCNSYFGDYKINGSSLTISGVGNTLMSCDDARNQREMEFLTALQSVTGYQIEGDTLTLLDAATNPLIEMNAAE